MSGRVEPLPMNKGKEVTMQLTPTGCALGGVALRGREGWRYPPPSVGNQPSL